MNLQEYINSMQELITDNPELAEAEVWTADDEEGNGYTIVESAPSIRYILKDDEYQTETCQCLDYLTEDLEDEFFEEDFKSEAKYREAIKKHIEDEYKTIVLLN